MISVLYLTKNPFGIDILKDNLDRQTFREFEVIVGDELNRKKSFEKAIGYRLKFIKPKPKRKENVRNLNSAYNELIDLAKGELCVFLQDYIWIPKNALERLWDWYEIYGDKVAFCTGGYGAEKPSFEDYRNGCLKPYQFTKRSIENDKGGVEKCHYLDFEINFASFPAKPLKTIRFDEHFDKCYGGDNYILAYNACKQGIKLFIDYDIKKIGFPEYFKRPKDFEEKHFNKLTSASQFSAT